MMLCYVSWPLTALKALCRCASRKLAPEQHNNEVYCVCVCVSLQCLNAFFYDPYARLCLRLGFLICEGVCSAMFGCCELVCVGPLFTGVLVLTRKIFVCIPICLSERTFPGVKCPLSTATLCGFCSVALRRKQAALIYHFSADGQRFKPGREMRLTGRLTTHRRAESELP